MAAGRGGSMNSARSFGRERGLQVLRWAALFSLLACGALQVAAAEPFFFVQLTDPQFGMWTGDRLGFFCWNDSEPQGHIDVDWFRYDYDGPKAGRRADPRVSSTAKESTP